MSTSHSDEKWREVWEGIRLRIARRGITRSQLFRAVRWAQDLIVRGLNGEPVPIPTDALRDFYDLLISSPARGRSYEDTSDILTEDELIDGLILELKQRSLWNE